MSLSLSDNWKQLRPRSGRLLKMSLYGQLGTIAENNYGQRPPFYWTAGNYGREAAAILKWYKDNLDYGREAVVFF